jgi:hypothetical protein
MQSAVVQVERHYQADIEWIHANADRVWEILNSDDGMAETFAAARSAGGTKAAVEKMAEVEKRVRERLAALELPPAPRNLVAALTAAPGLRRDTTRAALKRMAARGELAEVYAAHFRT